MCRLIFLFLMALASPAYAQTIYGSNSMDCSMGCAVPNGNDCDLWSCTDKPAPNNPEQAWLTRNIFLADCQRNKEIRTASRERRIVFHKWHWHRGEHEDFIDGHRFAILAWRMSLANAETMTPLAPPANAGAATTWGCTSGCEPPPPNAPYVTVIPAGSNFANWHLLTKSRGGTISLLKNLTKDECEFARNRALGYPATEAEKKAKKEAEKKREEALAECESHLKPSNGRGSLPCGNDWIWANGWATFGNIASAGDIETAECFE
jgi:hypothetical protein